MTPDDQRLNQIIDRLLKGTATDAEKAELRRSLSLSGDTIQKVNQSGERSGNIGQVSDGEVQFGDRTYYGVDAETLRTILRQELSQQAATAHQRPAVVGLATFPSVPVWVGRDDLLTELVTILQEDGPQALVLVGQGGIGKTSLALKLLEALGVQDTVLAEDCAYEQVIALRVEQGTSFDQVAGLLLDNLAVPVPETPLEAQQKINLILQRLAKSCCLLLLDNLETILHPATHDQAGRAESPEWGKLLTALANNNHHSQIIITSRETPLDLADPRSARGGFHPKRVKRIDVSGIADADSVALLRQYELQDSEADLAWVAEKTGGHVLLLELLASIAYERPGYLRQHPELVTTEATPILREQLGRQSAAARELLKRMSVLRYPVDGAGLTFLRLYTADFEQDERFEIAAILEEPATLTPEELAETDRLIAQLWRSSLVQRRYDRETCQHFYDLHRVVVEFLQAEYAEEQPQLLQAVYRFYCTGKTIKNPKTLEELRPVLEAQYFAFQLGNYSEASSLLMSSLEDYLTPWGYWTLLNDLYHQILPHVEKSTRPYYLTRLGLRQRDWGNWDLAESHYQKALVVAQEEDDEGLIANLNGQLGDIERNRGNWDAAESLYHQSLKIKESLGDRSGMATSYGQLGDIERNRGNWAAAESLYHQSLEISESLGDRAGMASSYGLLGEIERNRGNWAAAESLYQQCLEILESLGDRAGMASSYGVLGDIESNRGNWDAAESLYQQSLEIRESLGDRQGIAISIGCLGENALGRGDLEAAEPLLRQALEQMEALGTKWHIAETNFDLALLERKRNNSTQAQTHYTTAHTLFQQL
ncbi:MAG: tetratricopeptide repeat protein, partial [Cyanobacteria bacterium P01_H01_bin.162]